MSSESSKQGQTDAFRGLQPANTSSLSSHQANEYNNAYRREQERLAAERDRK